MNNKGFTLVELLAVLVILVTISLVAVGNVTNSLVRREQKECEEQKSLVIGAAKIYFSLNNDKTSVTIGTLLNDDYLDSQNPKMVLSEDGKMLGKLSVTDKVSKGSSSYTYTGTTCES